MKERRENEPFLDPVQDDAAAAIENGEPYFPPTDPVTGEEPVEAQEVGGTGDEALAARVKRALAEDASTTDLDIEVEVDDAVATLSGRVSGPEDVDNALAVAGRVTGITDVADEIEIEANIP